MTKIMNDKFFCDICGAPMVLEKKGKSKSGNRIRRFTCTICDFKKTIYASGIMDEKFIPDKGLEAVKKMFKKEENNRSLNSY